MAELEIVYLSPQELTPYENNTRKHNQEDIDQIKASIAADGFNDPIGIWGEQNIIVEGHGRQIAAIEMGLDRVPCIRLDHMTEVQRRDYAIRHNRTAELSAWDFSMLREEIAALELQGLDMSYLNGIGEELDALGSERIDDYKITEDNPPELPEEPIAKRGQIWQLGEHRLICGDSTNPADVEAVMDGALADLLLTDPPYNVNLGSNDKPFSNHNDGILNDNMEDAPFIDFLHNAFESADNVMRPGAVWYVFYAGLQHSLFDSAIKSINDWWLHEQLIWVKGNHVLGRHSDYQWKHEPCLYGWKTGKEHYFTDSRAETTVIEDTKAKLSGLKKSELIKLCEKLMGENQSTTVLYAEKANSAEVHPSIKPQGLLTPLIINSSKPGWVVLDIFGGSGSTLIACEQVGRKCYMVEMDPHYCDVIIQRWENFTGKKAVKLN